MNPTLVCFGLGALVVLARFSAAGWTSPVNITALADYEVGPRAARDASGHLHLVWYGGAAESTQWRIHYQFWNGSSWNAPVALSGQNAGGPDIAVDGAGNLHVVWHGGGNPEEVYYRKNTAGSWGSIANLSNTSGARSLTPRLAVDGSGDHILVTWHEHGQTGGNWDIIARKFTAGTWGAFENVSDDTTLSRTADVVLDAFNNFHLAWEDLDTRNLFYRQRSATGGYGSKTPLDATSGRSYGASLAVAPNGQIHVAWHDDNNDWEILHRSFNGAAWSAIANLSNHPDPDHADNTPSITIDSNNQAHVLWHDYQNVYYAHQVGGLWRPRYIIGPGSVTGVGIIEYAGNHRLHALWQNRDAGTWDVYHALQDLPDATPPSPITQLRAAPASASIRLDWRNPPERDFIGTLIRWKTSGFPLHRNDGVLLTNIPGPGFTATHRGLTNGVPYYYSAFAYDAEPNYAAAAQVSAVPVAAPKSNLLVNAAMTTFAAGVASGWQAYKVNDPNNAISFGGDTANAETSPSQAILGIDSTHLPSSGLSAAGLRQVVSNVVPGRVYLFVGYQDLYASDFAADSRRYLHNFGINTLGGTASGPANLNGTIGGAGWMTSEQALWNNNPGGAPFFGGFHRARAAFVAEHTNISVWTGLTIDNAAARDNATVKFNLDTCYLFEFEFPTQSTLQNSGFDEPALDLQDGSDTLPEDWLPAGGGIGQVNSWAVATNFARVQDAANQGLRIWSRRGTVHAAAMQRVAATPGTTYTLRAWTRASGQDNALASVGIDPLGGGDALSSDIIWQSTTSPAWTQLTVVAHVPAAAVTVFVRTQSRNNVGANYQWSDFDDLHFAPGGIAPLTIVPAGAAWKFLDNGSDLGTAWRASGYNDHHWASGPAPLGFGDGDEATVINGGPSTNRYMTAYFRRAFTVTDPSRFRTTTVHLLRDDGAVVYLNGVEIFRSNMPTGLVSYLTPADSSVPTGPEEVSTFFSTNVNPGLLMEGHNILAVEVHQANNQSSDLSFDLALTGLPGPSPPRLFIARHAGGGHTLRWAADAAGFHLWAADALGAMANWQPLVESPSLVDGWNILELVEPSTHRFYRLLRD